MILAALVVFRLAGEAVSPAAEAALPRPVGSLQKPWVVAAWAEAHPDVEPPSVDCTGASGCWRESGHGRVDLPRAFAQSCNAYFLALARATPEETRARALESAGFEVRRPLSPLSPASPRRRSSTRIEASWRGRGPRGTTSGSRSSTGCARPRLTAPGRRSVGAATS